jgi:hypothetical protein
MPKVVHVRCSQRSAWSSHAPSPGSITWKEVDALSIIGHSWWMSTLVSPGHLHSDWLASKRNRAPCIPRATISPLLLQREMPRLLV